MSLLPTFKFISLPQLSGDFWSAVATLQKQNSLAHHGVVLQLGHCRNFAVLPANYTVPAFPS